MAYQHIDNLYKNQDILYFKRCFALEKVHGTSAHIAWHPQQNKLSFFSGGANRDQFVSLFDKDTLLNSFAKCFKDSGVIDKIIVFGEAHGGKLQKMNYAYGPSLLYDDSGKKMIKVWECDADSMEDAIDKQAKYSRESKWDTV